MASFDKTQHRPFQAGLKKWQDFVASYTGEYDLSVAKYEGVHHKVKFICPHHGLMSTTARNLMRGKRCLKCATAARGKSKRLSQEEVIKRFKSHHGDRYDYSLVEYKNQGTHVPIICKVHGIFDQKPEFHMNGAGCPACYSARRGDTLRDDNIKFQAKVARIFDGLLNVDHVEYKNSQQDITVWCNKHKEFFPTRTGYLAIDGCNPCTKCNHMRSSGEDEVANYLSIFTEVNRHNRKLVCPKEIDIYLPEHKLAIEYHGMFWHTVFSAEDERAKKHASYNKYKDLEKQGIRLITIFQTEWENQKPVLKRLLRNAIGKSKGKVMARKCAIAEVDNVQANQFFKKYHIQGAGVGRGINYGLFYRDKLVACMRFDMGATSRNKTHSKVWELVRYASRVNVAGGASRLLNQFMTDYKPDELKSFSDNRHFSGNSYEVLGFELEKELLPDYSIWHPKLGLMHKSRWQRRYIPNHIATLESDEVFDPNTDSRSEREMTYLLGAGRLYECGQKRWVHTSKN